MVIDEDQVVIDDNEIEEEVIEDSDTSEEESEEEVLESDQEPEETEDDDEEDDRIVTIGDAEPGEEDEHTETPGWVKKVRKINLKQERELKLKEREIEQLRAQLQGKTEQKPVELGEKPTLKSAGYDDKKYEQDLAAYYERKRILDEQQAQTAKKVEAQQKAFAEKVNNYATKKEEHAFRDFDEVEDLVSKTLNPVQQRIIVQTADDAALVVYALGKNPKKLDEMLSITDPVTFAAKLGKLESQLKVSKRKAPAPEQRVSGGKTGGSANPDKVLERLRKKAEKTDDYTEVVAYKKKLREQES